MKIEARHRWTMRGACVIASAIMLCASAVAQPSRDYPPARIEEGLEPFAQHRLEALAAAYAFAQRIDYHVQESLVLIYSREHLLIVRFSSPYEGSIDGVIEIAYDPVTRKIVKYEAAG